VNREGATLLVLCEYFIDVLFYDVDDARSALLAYQRTGMTAKKRTGRRLL